MNLVNSPSALVFALVLTSSSAMANGPTMIGCGKATPATLSLDAEAWTSAVDTCPLLEKKKFRKLVDKFGAGTVFAHPVIPDTCLSGKVTSGTLLVGENTIDIDPTTSYTESAQRLFPVPTEMGYIGLGDFDLFAVSDDGTLQVGAAMTAVHLEGKANDENYTFDLIVDDHFLMANVGEDTEDFLIIGSKGEYKVSGRLTGKGQIISQAPLGVIFNITGTICLK